MDFVYYSNVSTFANAGGLDDSFMEVYSSSVWGIFILMRMKEYAIGMLLTLFLSMNVFFLSWASVFHSLLLWRRFINIWLWILPNLILLVGHIWKPTNIGVSMWMESLYGILFFHLFKFHYDTAVKNRGRGLLYLETTIHGIRPLPKLQYFEDPVLGKREIPYLIKFMSFRDFNIFSV